MYLHFIRIQQKKNEYIYIHYINLQKKLRYILQSPKRSNIQL